MDLYLFYKNRIFQLDEKEKECISKDRQIPFYRLFVITIGIVLFYFLLQISILISFIVLLLFLIIFFIIVKIDNRNSAKMKELQLLKMLNENEIKYLDGLCPFLNDGNKYKNETHPYSNDLDIFGNLSLFHYVNRTTLSQSSDILAEWLLFPANIEEIKDRNNAVIELNKNIEWRQKIFILGYSLENMENSVNNLIRWVKKIDKFSFNKRYILLCTILSSMTLISFALSYIFSIFYIPVLLLCIHFFIIRKSNSIVKYSHAQVTKNSKILETYAFILKEIENKQFYSIKLNTWLVTICGDNYSSVKSIHFLKNNFGMAIGFSYSTGYYISKTLNCGTNWDFQSFGLSSPQINSVYIANDSSVYLVGGIYTIKKSTNFGSSWIEQNHPAQNILSSVYFPASDTGFVTGNNGKILKTLNGGNNWLLQNSNTTKKLNSIFFINSNIGFAVGDSGTIIRTNNGGINVIAENENIESKIKIYPDPFIHYLHIESTENADITIINTYGQIIENFKISNTKTERDLNHLLPGIYFIFLKTKSNLITRKIIKQ